MYHGGYEYVKYTVCFCTQQSHLLQHHHHNGITTARPNPTPTCTRTPTSESNFLHPPPPSEVPPPTHPPILLQHTPAKRNLQPSPPRLPAGAASAETDIAGAGQPPGDEGRVREGGDDEAEEAEFGRTEGREG
ncbi:hypothetical protein LTR50_003135 [Elasticomyces elasticus]|nr:hypothetical protein LTR50_003135 [Elasticomyces elasticus]